MLRRTHIAAGIALSLALLRPHTAGGLICVVTGGAVGGWISDIDCKGVGFDEEATPGVLPGMAFCGTALLADALVGEGACAWTAAHWGPGAALAAAVFALAFGYGLFLAEHRGFTHSLLGAACFGVSLASFCEPLALPFIIGFASHLALDLFNRRGERLLFPLKKRFCLNLFPAEGRVDTVLRVAAVTASAILLGWCGARVLPENPFSAFLGGLGARLGRAPVIAWLVILSVWTLAAIVVTREDSRGDWLIAGLCALGGAAAGYAAMTLTGRRGVKPLLALAPALTALHTLAAELMFAGIP